MSKLFMIVTNALIVFTLSLPSAQASSARILRALNQPVFQKFNAQMEAESYKLGDVRDVLDSSIYFSTDVPMEFELVFYNTHKEPLSKRFLMSGDYSSVRIRPMDNEN